jgi:hypothetical protein
MVPGSPRSSPYTLVDLDQSATISICQFFEMWHFMKSIEDVPENCDLRLAVIEAGGGVHPLVFPCRREGCLWVDAKTHRLVGVYPTHWQEWQ